MPDKSPDYERSLNGIINLANEKIDEATALLKARN